LGARRHDQWLDAEGALPELINSDARETLIPRYILTALTLPVNVNVSIPEKIIEISCSTDDVASDGHDRLLLTARVADDIV